MISPDTLLRLRAGNSFEMATLLCSLLIANRYGALVVSGYASREVANDDQQRVACPDIPIRSSQHLAKVHIFTIIAMSSRIYFHFRFISQMFAL